MAIRVSWETVSALVDEDGALSQEAKRLHDEHRRLSDRYELDRWPPDLELWSENGRIELRENWDNLEMKKELSHGDRVCAEVWA